MARGPSKQTANAMVAGRILRTIGGPPPKAARSDAGGRANGAPDKVKGKEVKARDMAEHPIDVDAGGSSSEDDMEEVVVEQPQTSAPMSRTTSAATTASRPPPSTPGTPMTDEEGGGTTGAGTTADEDGQTDEDASRPYDYGFSLGDEDGGDGSAVAGPSTGPDTATGQQRDDGAIVISLNNEAEEAARKQRIAQENRRKPLTSRDRALRLDAHKAHALALLCNARIRNAWCSEPLLKARLLSLAPHHLHQAFHITPSTHPDQSKRSRLFLAALLDLATWWANDFWEIPPEFRSVGLRTRTWEDVVAVVNSMPRLKRRGMDKLGNPLVDGSSGKGKGKARATEDDAKAEDEYMEYMDTLKFGGERIRTVKSMQKKALQGFGGRDTSAQLFVALCRAMGLGARLVVSLQPVNWRSDKTPTSKKANTVTLKGEEARVALEEEQQRQTASPSTTPSKLTALAAQARANVTTYSIHSPKQKKIRRKGKPVERTQSEEEEEEEMEEVPVPDSPAPITPSINGSATKKSVDELYKLRPSKSAGNKLGSAPTPKRRGRDVDLQPHPPVFWAEVYSRPDQKWIPVDPSRGSIQRRKDYEPTSETGPIRMLYVVAFEEDGYAREVTVRYAQAFGAKTSKLRAPAKGDNDWWDRIMKTLERPYRLKRDDLEDAELHTSQVSEGMPMHVNGFKDHPLFVLERHLKREEVIMPKREVGRFKGEAVYRRDNVIACKTPENWMRIGRRVKPREEPLKWVKMRAVTIDKRRAQELAAMEGKEPMQQGLYAEWQTELYRPPPIRDGVIPVNAFNNVDLYVPTMLPEGAAHLPYKGIAKVAKQLGINYAEACTGFEFKKRRAIPVITGIVVAEDQQEALLEAYWESAAAAEEKELAKRQEKALKKWQRLIQGIQIRARLQEQYGEAHVAAMEDPNYERPKEITAGSKLIARLNTTANTATGVNEDILPTQAAADARPDTETAADEAGRSDASPAPENSEPAPAVLSRGEVAAVEPAAVEPAPTRKLRIKVKTPAPAPAKATPARASKRKATAPPTDAPPRRSTRARKTEPAYDVDAGTSEGE